MLRIGILSSDRPFTSDLATAIAARGEMDVSWIASSSEAADLVRTSPVDGLVLDLEEADWHEVLWLAASAEDAPAGLRVVLAGDGRGLIVAARLDAAQPLPGNGAADRIADVLRGLLGAFSPVPTTALTPREVQVLEEIRKGSTNKAIAATLGVSVHTVNTHVTKIMRKLRIRNRAQAGAWAQWLLESPAPPGAERTEEVDPPPDADPASDPPGPEGPPSLELAIAGCP